MIDDHSIARPYAQAAFQHAVDSNSLSAWLSTLEILSVAVQSEQLVSLLSNPQVNQQQVTDILIDVAKATDSAMKNFILLLADYKRLAIVPAIFELFNELKMEHERLLDAHVFSPFELSAEQSSKLQAALAKKFDQQVALHQQVDPSLIGGAVIRIGDLVIDNSILGKINRFKAHLNLKETV